jgi:hypothetical protein
MSEAMTNGPRDPMNERLTFTVDEVARLLGISRSGAYDSIARPARSISWITWTFALSSLNPTRTTEPSWVVQRTPSCRRLSHRLSC